MKTGKTQKPAAANKMCDIFTGEWYRSLSCITWLPAIVLGRAGKITNNLKFCSAVHLSPKRYLTEGSLCLCVMGLWFQERLPPHWRPTLAMLCCLSPHLPPYPALYSGNFSHYAKLCLSSPSTSQQLLARYKYCIQYPELELNSPALKPEAWHLVVHWRKMY